MKTSNRTTKRKLRLGDFAAGEVIRQKSGKNVVYSASLQVKGVRPPFESLRTTVDLVDFAVCCDDWHTPIAKTVVNLRERVRLMQQSLERFEKDIGIHGKSDEEVMGIKDWGGL